MPSVTFEGDGKRVSSDPGTSLLDSALAAGVPIAHSCGGTSKCSTCRLLVVAGSANLTPRTASETDMASRLHFCDDVRLACQTRATGDATVRRLVTDAEDAALVETEFEGAAPRSSGEERRAAILFCDVRSFTAFSESHLPYDVVHVLNRWFTRAESAVVRHGGTIDNFMGDGLMALFGIARPETPVLDAVRAALDLLAAARDLSKYVETHFGSGFRVGCGIHWGDVILGAVGAGERRRLTAIGDAVNLAARVESANRAAGTEILVSREAYAEVENAIKTGRRIEVPIRGKTGMYALYEVTGLK